MWILNVTPDSFYDGGKFQWEEEYQRQIKKMIADEVDIIDVWWFSSQPWAEIPSVEEEIKRVLPVLDILEKYNIDVSIDTCRSEVVEKILKYKCIKCINDISGLSDERILELIAGKEVCYILVHTQWTPENMQNNPQYEDVVEEVGDFFEKKIRITERYGVKNVILDPWFWFGKNIKHNYHILKNLSYYKRFNLPILVGLSRKSMMYKFLDSAPDKVLSETVALNLLALQKWASIIRVHDVKEHKNVIKIFNLMQNL